MKKTKVAWALMKDGEITAIAGQLAIYETEERAEENPDGIVHDRIMPCTITWEENNG
jgi:hypothetical protein